MGNLIEQSNGADPSVADNINLQPSLADAITCAEGDSVSVGSTLAEEPSGAGVLQHAFKVPISNSKLEGKGNVELLDPDDYAATERDLALGSVRVLKARVRRLRTAEIAYLYPVTAIVVMLLQGASTNNFRLLSKQLLARHRRLTNPVELHPAITITGQRLMIPVLRGRHRTALDKAHRLLGEQIHLFKGKWFTMKYERATGEKSIFVLADAVDPPTEPGAHIQQPGKQIFNEIFANRVITSEDEPFLAGAIKRASSVRS